VNLNVNSVLRYCHAFPARPLPPCYLPTSMPLQYATMPCWLAHPNGHSWTQQRPSAGSSINRSIKPSTWATPLLARVAVIATVWPRLRSKRLSVCLIIKLCSLLSICALEAAPLAAGPCVCIPPLSRSYASSHPSVPHCRTPRSQSAQSHLHRACRRGPVLPPPTRRPIQGSLCSRCAVRGTRAL
jgi:hypothetical protein